MYAIPNAKRNDKRFCIKKREQSAKAKNRVYSRPTTEIMLLLTVT